ncbi:LolA family protein [Labrys wisconsinensis]|uniref:Outer membrane lipoprotein-sorting protein n=1 Tax=Labrys wisconsinensis TaxID=425677 RepID=A0ABU0JK51_9HYPH|nr:outer-membrane lipoprotein carrier protein LolA [Labrys wisconsinensis]MDQ0474663.1 outer membrane lipoprotein-sorting protein [Labrys wisconsinensis]
MPSVRTLAFVAGLTALAGSAFAGFAQAQTDAATPLPPSRPPAAAQEQVAGAAPAIKPPPAIGAVPIVALGPFDPGAITPAQAQAIRGVNAYLNSVRVMSGSFTQLAPDGTRSSGQFWVSKPGKLRFQYAPPSPLELIADGRSVAVRNRKDNTQDLYFISQTPLRFLLADSINLIQDASLIGLYGDKDSVTVTLEEKSSIGGSARLSLMFSAKDYALKQWTITDAQGYDTTVSIYDVDTKSQPNNKLFYINEQRTL